MVITSLVKTSEMFLVQFCAYSQVENWRATSNIKHNDPQHTWTIPSQRGTSLQDISECNFYVRHKDPEGSCGEGGGRGDRDGEYM